jgi:hypothetical protein
MIMLGPVEQQCWLSLLDEANLKWWQMQQRSLRMQVARERHAESVVRVMSPWLVQQCAEGMRRLALRLPCVRWMPGPLQHTERQRRLGFWPVRHVLQGKVHAGEIVTVSQGQWSRVNAWDDAGEGQRYWLVYVRGGPGFSLFGRTGRCLWRVDGERWGRDRRGTLTGMGVFPRRVGKVL